MNLAEKPTAFVPSSPDIFWITSKRLTGSPCWDPWPHRMACARCGFYRPKNSAAALFLEGRKNLLGLQQDIPLTEADSDRSSRQRNGGADARGMG
jgi:hypothetical protein